MKFSVLGHFRTSCFARTGISVAELQTVSSATFVSFFAFDCFARVYFHDLNF